MGDQSTDGISRCPVCGDQYRAALGPSSSLTSPDEGDWCFDSGWFFIHEALKWSVNSDTEQSEANDAGA